MARILILIDDDHDDGRAACALLRARGHAVSREGDANRHDLVLCGARHPQVAALAAQDTHAVLLALCGPGDSALREDLLDAGFDGYIGLPLEADSFALEVEAFLPPPTLLLVDDDPFMLGLLADLVEDQGWRVLSAASGEEALALLAREPVAVVLSDQRMAGMSGAALLAQVRARWPLVFRMLLSGQRDDAAISQALQTGDAERFQPKPWQGEALIGALREAFALQAAPGRV